ncbi:MAG: peptidylprolyl isomerase [Proteobacteria bacterium]|jgi:FKBP-type peptidyl-prolyl cis-trans isomerase SlyD|nr:peptidylprolyl isomerase [Pseudomonadota bacterium]MDA1301441.1 peptidylprolyl isomerase [Pseudomonadota bacterium]
MPFYYRFNYAIRNDADAVVDSSAGGEALSFVEGDGTMIPGLEAALKGKSSGDEFQVTIGPDDAYGWRQNALVRTLSADMFDADVSDVEPGMIFQVGSGDQREVVKVVAVDEEGITVDGNHPLAGLTFHFDISVLEARPARPDDLDGGSPQIKP